MKYKIIIGAVVLNICILLGAVGFFYSKLPKVAYINMGEVYENFQLKKELEGKLNNVEAVRKNILDSLELEVQLAGNRLSGKEQITEEEVSDYKRKRQELLLREQEFGEQSQSISQNYSDQVWKQLNQYIRDYGSRHGYSIIMGANGTGNLMHADESLDITEQVLAYVNDRYKGVQ